MTIDAMHADAMSRWGYLLLVLGCLVCIAQLIVCVILWYRLRIGRYLGGTAVSVTPLAQFAKKNAVFSVGMAVVYGVAYFGTAEPACIGLALESIFIGAFGVVLIRATPPADPGSEAASARS